MLEKDKDLFGDFGDLDLGSDFGKDFADFTPIDDGSDILIQSIRYFLMMLLIITAVRLMPSREHKSRSIILKVICQRIR